MEQKIKLKKIIHTIRKALASQQFFGDCFCFLLPSLLINHSFINTSETSVYNQLDYVNNFDVFNNNWRAFDRDKIFRRKKFTNENFHRLTQFYISKVYNNLKNTDYMNNIVGFGVFIILYILIALYNFTLSEKTTYV